MIYSNLIQFDEKLSYSYALDLLIIVKMLEELMGTEVSNDLYIFDNLSGENMSYDEFWYGLEFFIDTSNIGKFEYEDDYANIEVSSLLSLMKQIDQFSPDKVREINDFLDSWNYVKGREAARYTFTFKEDTYILHAAAEQLEAFKWHQVCERLITLDEFCLKQLKELSEND